MIIFPRSFRRFWSSLLKDRLALSVFLIFALLEFYNLAVIPAILGTEKSIETKAIADNAALKQTAEAETAEQKAINETEVAAYAERKQKADVRRVAAEARKAASEAVSAREIARNADLKEAAEAAAQDAEAELKKQLTLIEIEVAKQAARRQKVEADIAEIEARAQEKGADMLRNFHMPGQ